MTGQWEHPPLTVAHDDAADMQRLANEIRRQYGERGVSFADHDGLDACWLSVLVDAVHALKGDVCGSPDGTFYVSLVPGVSALDVRSGEEVPS